METMYANAQRVISIVEKRDGLVQVYLSERETDGDTLLYEGRNFEEAFVRVWRTIYGL